jgi:hypothetical protein
MKRDRDYFEVTSSGLSTEELPKAKRLQKETQKAKIRCLKHLEGEESQKARKRRIKREIWVLVPVLLN